MVVVRVVILDGKILGSVKREVISDNDFRSNISLGAEATNIELTEIEKKDSMTAAKAVAGRLVGVDFIPAKNREKDKPFFIEVNSNPGLKGIEGVFSKKFSMTKKILTTYMNRDNWR